MNDIKELTDEELKKVTGGDGGGLHVGFADIHMFTKDNCEIEDTDVDLYDADTNERFTVVYISNNNYEGNSMTDSTTFTLASSSGKFKLFTATKGAQQNTSVYKINNVLTLHQ